MKHILKAITYFLISVVITSCDSCKKDKPDPPPPAGEANLVVALDPVPSTTTPVVAMGTTHEFRVKVESAMPEQGVDIQVVYRKDGGDNAAVFTRSYTTTTSPQAVTITGIPFSQVGTVTVVVTSKTKATNTVTKTFKLVRK